MARSVVGGVIGYHVCVCGTAKWKKIKIKREERSGAE
jgi:hypothetical protein